MLFANKRDAFNKIVELIKREPQRGWTSYTMAQELLRFSIRLSVRAVSNLLSRTAEQQITVISWTAYGIPTYTHRTKA